MPRPELELTDKLDNHQHTDVVIVHDLWRSDWHLQCKGWRVQGLRQTPAEFHNVATRLATAGRCIPPAASCLSQTMSSIVRRHQSDQKSAVTALTRVDDRRSRMLPTSRPYRAASRTEHQQLMTERQKWHVAWPAVSVEWWRLQADWQRGSRLFSVRYSFSRCATTLSVTFDRNDKFDTGRKLAMSMPGFFKRGDTMACFWLSGSQHWDNEALTRVVTNGVGTSTISRSKNDGIGSRQQDLTGNDIIMRRITVMFGRRPLPRSWVILLTDRMAERTMPALAELQTKPAMLAASISRWSVNS